MSATSRPVRRGRTTVDGDVALHWVEWDGAGPAIVCIHGLTSHAWFFEAFADALPRRRVIAVDLRGRGESDRPAAGAYGLRRHAEDVAALVSALGLGSVPVVGHSMGGYVAALLAVHHPELVSHLVLADGGSPDPTWTEASLRAQISTALERLSTVVETPDEYVDYWSRNGFTRPWTSRWEAYVRRDIEPRAGGGYACRAVAAGAEQDLGDIVGAYDVEHVLPAVTVPALSSWAPCGLADPEIPLVPRVAMEQAAALMPRARFLEVRGANHYTMFLDDRCAGTLAAAVADLLRA